MINRKSSFSCLMDDETQQVFRSTLSLFDKKKGLRDAQFLSMVKLKAFPVSKEEHF